MHEHQLYGELESESRNFSFAYGLLVGAALGAAAALLFAPKAGTELRGQLADATSRIRRRASQAYGRATGAANEMGDTADRSYTSVP